MKWVRWTLIALGGLVGHDGRALFFMASQAFYFWSDEDVAAVIAYVKQVPPVDNELPAREFAVMGRVMMGAGMAPPVAADLIDHTIPPPPAPETGVTAAYGEYLALTCSECHGEQQKGSAW